MSYLQKYHLQKVEPVKNRTKQTPHDFFKVKPKVQKSNAVKIPIKHRPPVHKHFFQKQLPKYEPQTPLVAHRTHQQIRYNQELQSQQQISKGLRSNLEEKVSHRSHKSLNFKSGKDNSTGTKIITAVQDFFNKFMKSNEGCNCGEPCQYSVNFFQWADVPFQIVKDHYFKVINKWEEYLKEGSKVLSRTNSTNDLNKRSSREQMCEQIRKNMIQIKKDIDRTQSESSTFQNNVFKQRQFKILMSYALEDSKVGYIQGMNMILSGLLYHIKEEIKTYAVFRKLIFNMRAVYLNNFSQCYLHIYQIKFYLKTHVNDLYLFFQNLNADLNIICLPWILSLLTCIIPLEYLHFIYEGFIQQKWIFFYKISLAIFIYHKQKIMTFDDAAEVLLLFSPTNQAKNQYDWQDIISFSKQITL